MNNTPKISIIVPCYNQVQYLNECLQSVFDQTYQNWECIIVNDGSPESPEEITREWMKIDSRFKYLEKENGGLSSARNAGIEIAKGEWILPLDADDKIGSKYIELLLNETNKGYEIVYSRLQLFGNENKVLSVPKYDFNKLLYFNPFYCSCIFRKEKWKKVGGYDTNLIHGMEDWEFWINIIYNSPTKVKRIDYIGFFYRRKEISMNVIIDSDEQKKEITKQYIIQKHISHYSKSSDYLVEQFFTNDKYKSHLDDYDKIFSKSWIGKILFSIAKKLSNV